MKRRTLLRSAAALAAGQTILPSWMIINPLNADAQVAPGEKSPAPNLIQTMNAMAPNTPVQVTRLRDTLFLLQGVGGNMVAQIGPDGKLLIDASIATAAPRVKEALAGLGRQPLQLLINTHWHFDHTDGNAAMHDAGALILAHENTRLRLSHPQRIAALGLDFSAAPTSGLPQEVFEDRAHLFFNNDELRLVHLAPAHTDSDIYILFKGANVIHAGDIWFNGTYPLIDDSSGGRIDGMVRAASELVTLADTETKIVPGHGPLGNKAALVEYHDMLVAVRDRVQGLKRSGRSLQEAQEAKPTSDLDKKWGKGSMTPDLFVQQVYKTLTDSRG